jgi:hypothetical protein
MYKVPAEEGTGRGIPRVPSRHPSPSSTGEFLRPPKLLGVSVTYLHFPDIIYFSWAIRVVTISLAFGGSLVTGEPRVPQHGTTRECQSLKPGGADKVDEREGKART